MAYSITSGLKGTNPTLQICDASSGSVRLAWEYPREENPTDRTDPDLLALKQEEAVHNLFRRLFLLTTEQYLKGETASEKRSANSQCTS
ncbi:hypothetical protein [Halomonas sp. M20]|uniref:hypothetical protein n=1 Tax=Halomonas sp. M20 TaxID=2763264 RepID=UPI001D0AD701|nr:hypothetical protein [Halomonas sp. M20]